MANPNYVQVPPNSFGLKISTTELTDSAGNVVERQNVVLADPNNAAGLAPVDPTAGVSVAVTNYPPNDQLSMIAIGLGDVANLLGAILAQLNNIGLAHGVAPTISPVTTRTSPTTFN